MSLQMSAIVIVAALFLGMLICLEIGRRLALHRKGRDPQGASTGLGAIEGAIFGLMGLLLAFTFSGAATRFDARRHLVVDEANAIGTAYLRLDLLPPGAQAKLREDFRRYLDSRLAVYRAIPDWDATRAALASSGAIQGEIWVGAVAATRDAPQATMLLLPALNQMIDITTTRTAAALAHQPFVIHAMLAVLALLCSVFAGHGMAGAKGRSWLHVVGFPAIMAITIYGILDLEYPRIGFIRLDAFDQVLMDVREGMR